MLPLVEMRELVAQFDEQLLPVRKSPLAEPLELTSLQGLVDYIREGGESDVAGTWKPFVHVIGPGKVELISSLDEHRRRNDWQRERILDDVAPD